MSYTFSTFIRMKEKRYKDLIRQLRLTLPTPYWGVLLEELPSMSLAQKKAIATICRAQVEYPEEGTTLHNKLIKVFSNKQIDNISELCDSPLHAGLLMLFVRLVPVSDEEIKNSYTASVSKERLVMESLPRPNEMDFSLFFHGADLRPLHPDIELDSHMAYVVRHAIENWRKAQTKRVFYPKMSYKTTSIDTRREAEKELSIFEDYDRNLTQVDLERIYHTEGIHIGGICEMRQKWYPSGLEPRTYYAMGGDAYHRSKYLQSIFNDLCEFLTPCSKESSLRPNRLKIDDGEYAYIYDLSSFTSNLHEHKWFMQALGYYCRGTEISLYDSKVGLLKQDLGEMILQYNTLNHNIPYSTERIYKEEPFVSYQCVGGLLGVYGNMATAKFLHAAIMLQVFKDIDKLNAAGDDGAGIIDNKEKPYKAVCTFGDMEWSKAYYTNEEGCICLKRPIFQAGGRLWHGNLINWPSFEYDLSTDQIDNRFPSIRTMARNKRKSAAASSMLTFLSQLQYISISDEDKLLITNYVHYFYEVHGLPIWGNVPQVSNLQIGLVPYVAGEFIGENPVQLTISHNYQGLAILSVRRTVPFLNEMLDGRPTFECNNTAHLTYLTKLGYLNVSKLTKVVYGEEGLHDLLEEFSNFGASVNEYTVSETIPYFLRL